MCKSLTEIFKVKKKKHLFNINLKSERKHSKKINRPVQDSKAFSRLRFEPDVGLTSKVLWPDFQKTFLFLIFLPKAGT